MIDEDFFCTETPCCVTAVGQLRQREVDPVLDLHLGDVRIEVLKSVVGASYSVNLSNT
ncbi:MAG: hypothetical protein MZU95_12085 [Desulfomicrobium escambiense]|nr:hypothetical protein [Desulfomicrobium escambiense]